MSWQSRVPAIAQTSSGQFMPNEIGQKPSDKLEIAQTASGQFGTIPFTLSWSHYVELMGIKDPNERSFYEIESRLRPQVPCTWSCLKSRPPPRMGCQKSRRPQIPFFCHRLTGWNHVLRCDRCRRFACHRLFSTSLSEAESHFGRVPSFPAEA